MAKKQTEPAAEGTSQPAKDKAEAGAKKPKETKAKEAKPAKDKPEPSVGKPAAPEVSASSPSAPPSTAPAESTTVKKRGARPGVPPARGKKLRNQIQQIQQKIAKEGPAPLKKAVNLLKQIKRA